MAHNKKKFLEVLEKNLGVITSSCKASGVPRRTVYNWLEKDAKFKESVNEIQEVSIDFAESKLMNKINKGDTTAIIFYLKTKGKKRGYVEKMEVENEIKTDNVMIVLPSNNRDDNPEE